MKHLALAIALALSWAALGSSCEPIEPFDNFDAPRLEPVAEVTVGQGAGSQVVGINIHPDGRRALIAFANGQASLWRLDDAGTPALQLATLPAGLAYAALWPDWSYAVAGFRVHDGSGGYVNGAALWRLDLSDNGLSAERLTAPSADTESGYGFDVVLSPDQHYAYTSGSNVPPRLWRIVHDDDGAPTAIQPLMDFDWSQDAAAFTLDGEYLVTAGVGELPRVWRLMPDAAPAARMIHEYADPGDAATNVYRLVCTPDGGLLVSGESTYRDDGPNATGRIWRIDVDAPDRALSRARLLTGHGNAAHEIALSADGTRMLTASQDGTAALWRIDAALGDAAVVCVLPVRAFNMHAVALAPDASFALTGHWDGIVRAWALPQ